MKGRIHSIESFGTVDGPGVRFVVFFQGCPMRCKYCHNPDTWDTSGGKEMTVEEIITGYEKNRAFYRKGGLTATGGEPLLQIDFLTALFTEAKKRGIHTCLDTSGITFQPEKEDKLEQMDRLMEVTDLVMLDIKHIDKEQHLELTKQSNDSILAFAKYLEKKGKDLWIRHVVVPGITYHEAYLKQLGRYIGTLTNLKRVQALPYHTMGVVKYENLKLDYPLKDVEPLSDEELAKAKEWLVSGIREVREKKV